MTEQEIATHLDIRKRRFKEIFDSPEKYKVCDQCQSIAVAAAAVCPHCACYRWRLEAFEVRTIAAIIGSRPFPVTAAVTPRLIFPSS